MADNWALDSGYIRNALEEACDFIEETARAGATAMGMFDKDDEPDWDKLLNERDKKIKEQDLIIAKLKEPYCLGRATIESLAENAEFHACGLSFIAASDLFKKDPYKRIQDLKNLLTKICGMAGAPDSTDACRNIIRAAAEELNNG
jgi:hypothetical protein